LADEDVRGAVRDVERHVFFDDTGQPDGACISSAMTGVEHDAGRFARPVRVRPRRTACHVDDDAKGLGHRKHSAPRTPFELEQDT